MTLPVFLRKIDEETKRMTKAQLAEFLHDYARTLPECQRDAFLMRMAGSEHLSSIKDEMAISPNLDERIAFFDRVQAGELHLRAEINEEYDDWYAQDDEEYLWEDPDDIIGAVEASIADVHACIDQEMFEQAWRLSEKILSMRITVDGEYDYADGEPLSLEGLDNHGLLTVDDDTLLETFQLDALVAAFLACTGEERCKALFQTIGRRGLGDSSFEQVITHSPVELPGVQEFLSEWIDFLGNISGLRAGELICEAILLTDSKELRLEAARKFANTHPGLYVQLFATNPDKLTPHELLELGETALREIDPSIRLRSKVALQTAEVALSLGKREDTERLWLEALISDPSMTNYLRLSTESEDFSKYKAEAVAVCRAYRERTGRVEFKKEVFWNPLEKDHSGYYYEKNNAVSLAFFCRDYKYVLEMLGENGGSGWILGYSRMGIALLLLYMYASDTLQKGSMEMCRSIVFNTEFTAKKYSEGLAAVEEEEDAACFWRVFQRWREIEKPTKCETEKLMRHVEDAISVHTDDIIRGDRRKQYGECALYIAALGEVMESQGIGTKQAVLMAYHDKYPRRTALHRELRNYGMRG